MDESKVLNNDIKTDINNITEHLPTGQAGEKVEISKADEKIRKPE